MKKQSKKPLSLAKESLSKLTVDELADVAGGAINENGSIRCSNRQGSCDTCGPTHCNCN